jgi:hypothetical protein
MPDLIKIGSTERNALTRIDELGKYTGCPTSFTPCYFIKVKNPRKYEMIIHNKLNEFRYNPCREFFTIRPELALEYFKMENLIQNNNDKQDFAENYLIMYNGEEIDNNELNEYKNDKVDKINKTYTDNNKINNKYSIDNDNDKNYKYENKCHICNKTFEFKSLFLRHKSKKLGCKQKIIDYDVKIKDIDDKILLITKNSLKTNTTCLFCECEYNTKSNLTRHINKSCTIKNKLLDDQKQLIIEKRDKDIENKNIEINNLKEIIIKTKDKEINTLKKMVKNICEPKST